MPHIIVKLWPGKSEKEKARLAEAITQAAPMRFDYREESALRNGLRKSIIRTS